jgi:hypothetical protein
MILNSPTISGSLTVTGNIIASGSITLSGSVASASYAATASFVALAQSASNAVSAETASFANAFTVAGTLTAQTLVVQTITSSVDFVTGSTRFGSLLANTHQFTGSVSMTGSLAVVTTGTELQVTSTGVNFGNALTDSHIISGSVRINPNGLFVSGSGTVGINRINPEFTLDVDGDIALNRFNKLHFTGGTAGDRARSYFSGDGNNNIFVYGPSSNLIATFGYTGNFGIGLIDPANKLQVNVSSNTTTLYNDNSYPLQIKNTSTTNNSYVGMYFGTGLGVGVTIQALYTNASTRSEGNLLFSTRNSGGSLAERMRITSSGAVLVGTETDNGSGGILQVNGIIDGTTFSASRSLTVNADNEKKCGMYRWNSDSTNLPESGFFSVIIYGNGDNVTAQMATHFQNANTYVRAFNTSWTAWRRII